MPLPVMMPKKAEIIFLKMAAENRNFRIIIGNQLSEILPPSRRKTDFTLSSIVGVIFERVDPGAEVPESRHDASRSCENELTQTAYNYTRVAVHVQRRRTDGRSRATALICESAP